MKVYYPPAKVSFWPYDRTIFLAGSIDNGEATEWQNEIIDLLKNVDGHILNPRRPDWDSSWNKDDTRLSEQIEWELDNLENARYILMCFMPDSKAPISFLELGLFKDKKPLVYCPNNFYRSTNVKITCWRYGIPYFNDWELYKQYLLNKFK